VSPTVTAPHLGALTRPQPLRVLRKNRELPTGSVANRDTGSIIMVEFSIIMLELVSYGGGSGRDQSQTCPNGSGKLCADQSDKPKSAPAPQ
jgi:hypothetical protein